MAAQMAPRRKKGRKPPERNAGPAYSPRRAGDAWDRGIVITRQTLGPAPPAHLIKVKNATTRTRNVRTVDHDGTHESLAVRRLRTPRERCHLHRHLPRPQGGSGFCA